MAVVVRVVGVFIKYCLIINVFEVEQVGTSHGLNQEELMDNVPCYSFSQYILGTSYMHSNVLGTAGRPRNRRDNHDHSHTLTLGHNLQLKACLRVSALV